MSHIKPCENCEGMGSTPGYTEDGPEECHECEGEGGILVPSLPVILNCPACNAELLESEGNLICPNPRCLNIRDTSLQD